MCPTHTEANEKDAKQNTTYIEKVAERVVQASRK
jgi:hypothetical protein